MARRQSSNKGAWHNAVFMLGVGGALAVLAYLMWQRRGGELAEGGSLLDGIGLGGGGGGGGYTAPAPAVAGDSEPLVWVGGWRPGAERAAPVVYVPDPDPEPSTPVSGRAPSGTRRSIGVRP